MAVALRRASAALLLLAATLAGPAEAVVIEYPGPPPPATPEAAPPSPLNARMSAGYQALARKDFEAAQTAFGEAAKLDAKAPQPLLALAEVARQRDNRADAERWLRRALDVAPASADVQRAWGRYQFSVKRYALAETALKKAAELDPAAPATQSDLADLYLNWLQRPADAAGAYRRLIKLKPEDAGAQFGLGIALAAQRQTREAASAFEQAAVLAPQNPLPLTALGRLYAASGEPQKALEAFDRALRVKADYAPALMERGDLYLQRNEHARAATDFEQVVKLTPKDAMNVYKLGTAYQLMGKPDAAERQYRQAIEIDGKFAPALNNLAAMSAERRQNLDAALDWAKRAVAIDPTLADFQDTLGSVHLARGESDAAIAAYRKATTLAPKNAEFYYGLGEALAQKGDKPGAVAAFKTALSVNPSFARSAETQKRIAALDGK